MIAEILRSRWEYCVDIKDDFLNMLVSLYYVIYYSLKAVRMDWKGGKTDEEDLLCMVNMKCFYTSK